MDLQSQIVAATRQELKQQAGGEADLAVEGDGSRVFVNGDVDLEALAMAISGAVAGGP